MTTDISADDTVLVVDLDGTLLRSDLLFESLWAAMAEAPFATLGQVWRQRGTRAGLKRALADRANIDVTQLPYDAEIIAYVTRWRDAGGRTALVTASDAGLAGRIAEHLGLFDEVHGSDGVRNLKGPVKATFLAERYGAGNYIYIGDSTADLPVWKGAKRCVTAHAAPRLRAAVDALGRETEHLGQSGRDLKPWIRALRPHQWLKNVLIFVPILASHVLTGQVLLQCFVAFVAFSLTASSVYVLNDLLDLDADRAHPRKRNRPLAAGAIPIGWASLLVPGLLAIGLMLALTLGPLFVGALALYYLVTMAYSLHLKRRTIIDIWVLATLYSMRILAGAAATGIVPSVWLMAFSIFFFFSLAAVKRQAELVDLSNRDALDARRRGYYRDDLLLIAMMAISSGYVSVLLMALYVRSPHVATLYSYPPALLGICLILLYWTSRIVMVTHRGQMHDDPLVFALSDRVSLICLAGVATCGAVAMMF